MSAAVNSTVTDTVTVPKLGSNEVLGARRPAKTTGNQNYKGFVGGVFSGIAKLSGKMRLVVCPKSSKLIMAVGHP